MCELLLTSPPGRAPGGFTLTARGCPNLPNRPTVRTGFRANSSQRAAKGRGWGSSEGLNRQSIDRVANWKTSCLCVLTNVQTARDYRCDSHELRLSRQATRGDAGPGGDPLHWVSESRQPLQRSIHLPLASCRARWRGRCRLALGCGELTFRGSRFASSHSPRNKNAPLHTSPPTRVLPNKLNFARGGRTLASRSPFCSHKLMVSHAARPRFGSAILLEQFRKPYRRARQLENEVSPQQPTAPTVVIGRRHATAVALTCHRALLLAATRPLGWLPPSLPNHTLRGTPAPKAYFNQSITGIQTPSW